MKNIDLESIINDIEDVELKEELFYLLSNGIQEINSSEDNNFNEDTYNYKFYNSNDYYITLDLKNNIININTNNKNLISKDLNKEELIMILDSISSLKKEEFKGIDFS